MFEPTKELQILAGGSMLVLSLGGAWSMISGSVVQFRVAGANFSVNKKLEKVEQIKETLEDTATELSRQPKVDGRKIRQIERALSTIEPAIDDTETEIQQDLEGLIDGGGN